MSKLNHFTKEQAEEVREEVKFYVNPTLRAVRRQVIIIVAFMLCGSMLGIYGYVKASQHADQSNCKAVAINREESNKRVKILHDYLVQQRAISRKERPLLKPLFKTLPGINPLLKRQDDLQDKLIQTYHPLPPVVCNR